ncbi:hypothetical protein A3K86_22005 [Photobacterium jeanii]|uniref:Lipoprotein n=1 Tax=Photobacterium jeanii TaxID=858640 RepID=A0A178K4C9_9GAMM|nr:DUF1439 domain-containing protein [Photobacterium jeanii]OAN11594.1 hypothetical protein A3K86_22005 [Photobacterium jeanii]PST91115.1 DUF1439 domain-containing protein [Photobacterium jeanii]
MPKITHLLALGALFLSGCASYTVTENEVQSYLDDNVQFERTVGIKGIAHANVAFDDVKVGIGRVASDRVNLDANAKAKVQISGQPSREIDMKMSFSAIPYYDKEEGAIFIKQLEMENLDVSPPEIGMFLTKPIVSPVVSLIGELISTRPIYRLDDDDFKQSLLKSAKPELLIKGNKIVIDL